MDEIEARFKNEFPKEVDISFTGEIVLVSRAIPKALHSMFKIYAIAAIVISMWMTPFISYTISKNTTKQQETIQKQSGKVFSAPAGLCLSLRRSYAQAFYICNRVSDRKGCYMVLLCRS
jgi:hypothetical protein